MCSFAHGSSVLQSATKQVHASADIRRVHFVLMTNSHEEVTIIANVNADVSTVAQQPNIAVTGITDRLSAVCEERTVKRRATTLSPKRKSDGFDYSPKIKNYQQP